MKTKTLSIIDLLLDLSIAAVCTVSVCYLYSNADAHKLEKIKQEVSNLPENYTKKLTNKSGVLDLEVFSSLSEDESVRFYLTDGSIYDGIVRTSEFDGTKFKVIGDILNEENAGFGIEFVLEKSLFGTILLKNSDISLDLQYSKEYNGYIFTKSEEKTSKL